MRISSAALFALALAALAAFAAVSAAAWPFKAALFPLVLSIPLCVLALLQFVLELRGTPGEPAVAPAPGSGRRTAAVFAWMAAFIVLVLLAGFPLTVPVFVLSYLLVHRAAGLGAALVATAVAWGVFHLLFERLLHFPFETGLIQDWLGK
jgi:hypothetical protein